MKLVNYCATSHRNYSLNSSGVRWLIESEMEQELKARSKEEEKLLVIEREIVKTQQGSNQLTFMYSYTSCDGSDQFSIRKFHL